MFEVLQQCPHGMPWYHWILDLWFLIIFAPIFMFLNKLKVYWLKLKSRFQKRV